MTVRKSKTMGDGPYHQEPGQEEAAGFFDGVAHGRSTILRSARTAFAPLGLTLSRRASMVAISETEPIPETVGTRPDNPFDNHHYEVGYRCGVIASRHLFHPAINTLLSHVELTMADNGVVTSSPNTARLAADFRSSGREVTAPSVITSAAADAILALFLDPKARASLLADENRSSPPLLARRSVLAGLCASLLLSAGLGWLAFRPASASPSLPDHTQVATIRPLEHWNVFSPNRRPIYIAIDDWIVTRYNLGNYQEILTVLNSFLPLPGNDEAKNITAMYIPWSGRWELARFLIPTIDPTLSGPMVRYNALIALHRAIRDTGSQFLSPNDRVLLQAYLQSGLETQNFCINTAQSVVNSMIQLGL